jgi:hypothetical protein
MKNSIEFEKLEKTIKEIREKNDLKSIFDKYLPKKMSKFKSLVSEKYGYNVAVNLKDDMEKIFLEFYA